MEWLIAEWTPLCLSFVPHLCARDHGGSSHPSLEGGLDCSEHQAPAGPIQSLLQGGCQAAAGLRGEVAAGPEVRVQRGRGAAPGAAAAVSKQGGKQTPSGLEGKGRKKPQTKYEAGRLNLG